MVLALASGDRWKISPLRTAPGPRRIPGASTALACYGDVREVQTGLWHWGGTRTGRAAGEDWDQMISSYAIACEAVLILLDPLAPVLIDELAADRETTIGSDVSMARARRTEPGGASGRDALRAAAGPGRPGPG